MGAAEEIPRVARNVTIPANTKVAHRGEWVGGKVRVSYIELQCGANYGLQGRLCQLTVRAATHHQKAAIGTLVLAVGAGVADRQRP